MRLVVPTPEPDPPAFRALAMEGLEPVEVMCRDEAEYGRLFAWLWDEGQPFIVCEHDIIPWPGAIAELADCGCARCSFRYPLHRANLALSFGIGKFDPEGPAPQEWAKTPWWLLDGLVVPVLNTRLGPPHVHEPPVAHARRLDE